MAVDLDGNVAAATSTGGITFGMPGRVGDSPLVGLGCLADNSLGALSATGHGESTMRMCLGSRILLDASAAAKPIGTATRDGLEAMRARVDGHGGIIAVLPDGSCAVNFTTERMAWGMATVGNSGDSGAGSGSGEEEEELSGGGVMRFGIDSPPTLEETPR